MRLLDHIAQCADPVLVRREGGELWRLTGASDFAGALRRCPLRYVLADDLVRTCTALAFSGGDELSGCLDLVHLPAEQMWIEWNEIARCAELEQLLPESARPGAGEVLRAGALLFAAPRGRAGSLRTFWLTRNEPQVPELAAIETLVDLDGTGGDDAPEALFDGRAVRVHDFRNPELDSVLQCASFRFEPSWRRYYEQVARDPATRERVVRRSLWGVAFDVPMLLALFLLLSIRADLIQQPMRPVRLNQKRERLGRRPLLEHIEVSAPVFMQVQPVRCESCAVMRRSPRLHHVRGHIVRRRNTVYWRGPHWRGHIRLGSIRSRTVALKLS